MSTDGTTSLREQLTTRIENTLTHRAELNGRGLILHFRLILRDLPFAGQPALLGDEQRAALDRLVERAARRDIKIFSIVGHASRPGTDAYNADLSRRRAEAAEAYLAQQIDAHPELDSTLYQDIRVRWRGEEDATGATDDPTADSDNPLDRRVEIGYRLKIIFPQPPGANVPRSRFWKVDFAAGGGTGYSGGNDGANDHRSIGVEFGVGTLTMLPDTEIGQDQTLQKPLTYESLGISIGLLSMLKKLSFLSRFPRVRRLLEALDDDLPGTDTYTHTANLLKNAGFALDIQSDGGEFYTDEPLSFEEMADFNFSCVAGNVSLFGTASGQLVLLHSPNFFSSTVIYGGGIAIAFPDASLNFVPVAAVQVSI